MTYSDNELVVSTQNVRVQYALESIDKLCFEDNAIVPGVRFSVEADAVTVMGEKPGSEIYIYDLNGVCVCKGKVGENGNSEISIRELSDGIYAVRTSSLSFKITKL